VGTDYELVSPKHKRVLDCGKSGFELTRLNRVSTFLKPYIIEMAEPKMQSWLGNESVYYLDLTLLEDNSILEDIYSEWSWPIAGRVWAWLQNLPTIDPDLYVVGDTGDSMWVWRTTDRKVKWPRPQAEWSIDTIFTNPQIEYYQNGFTSLPPWDDQK